MFRLLTEPALRNALVAAMALGTACAVLSVVVVMRRWAFIGEGISHSGFAGAGTVWMLALAFPRLDHPAAPYAGIMIACVVTAFLIGYFSRVGRLNTDAAIGIFLVASLAWGFLAQSIYFGVRRQMPAGWNDVLIGQLLDISGRYAVMTLVACAAIVSVLGFMSKEILLYCFDPVAAEVSGIRVGLIHYLLMGLVAVALMIGIRIAGSLLVTALLILPGATASLIATRLRTVVLISIATGLTGAVGGLIATACNRALPAGPCIVLVMFLIFLGAYFVSKVQMRSKLGEI